MAELGVDVRVWVGWCPDEQIETGLDGRLQKGIIVAGPIPPGPYISTSGFVWALVNWWRVRLDDGREVDASEDLLTPIDDDEETIKQSNEEEITV